MRIHKTIILALFLFLSAVKTPAGFTQASYPPQKIFSLAAIRAYQRLISPARGASCPMVPSCSAYSAGAFSEGSALRAFALSADRLYRCGRDLHYYEVVKANDAIRFLDPLEAHHPGADGVDPGRFKAYQVVSESYRNTSLNQPAAQRSDSDDDSKLFYFAQSLQASEDYDRAITEYKRLIYFFPYSSYKIDSLFFILLCYYENESFDKAIDWGGQLLNKDIEQGLKDEISFYIALSYFKTAKYSESRDYVKIISREDNLLPQKGEMLKGLSFAHEYRWQEAGEVFMGVPFDSAFYDEASRTAEIAARGEALPLKNPAAAGFLSVIPGMGYLYSGHRQTALSSFIMTGLFAAGSVQSFRNDNDGLGVVLGLFGLGWYSGNIYGSVRSAHRHNEHVKKNLVKEITVSVGLNF